MKYAGMGTPQSRFACQLPFQGSLFPLLLWKASPERGGGPLAVEGSSERERASPVNRTDREYTYYIGLLFIQLRPANRKF